MHTVSIYERILSRPQLKFTLFTASPLNYRNFPKSVCTSVNEVICHVSLILVLHQREQNLKSILSP